jgi:hypothetical protein
MSRSWIERRHRATRRSLCEHIAVGSEGFIEQVKNQLGSRAQHRQLLVADGLYALREPVLPYGAAISIGKMRL